MDWEDKGTGWMIGHLFVLDIGKPIHPQSFECFLASSADFKSNHTWDLWNND